MVDKIDIETKKALISRQGVFSALNDSELDVLATIFIEKKVSSGDVIVNEGDLVDSVYLIVSGQADVLQSINNNPKNIHSVAHLGPKEAIGLNETGFYSISGVRTATVVALTDMLLLRMSVAAFHGFALAYPHVSEIMRRNASKLLMTH